MGMGTGKTDCGYGAYAREGGQENTLSAEAEG